uniref:Uncharacterized protein n=1 Tax=viral metagenome TaxID=1070528 RepID=A0A6C0CNV4_9ZZZZ
MKDIYFLPLVFILILIPVILNVSKEHNCLSGEVFYFGTPGFVREGFTASEYAHGFSKDRHIFNNYPYFAAVHDPTDNIIEKQKTINIFNDAISDYITKYAPKGNKYTINYPCRKSTISYNNNKYNNCGPYASNDCKSPIIF